MKYTNEKMQKIWSEESIKKNMFDIWRKSALVKETNGFEHSMSLGKNKPDKSTHEVINALREFIEETSLINAHAGFTSSDIIDNARLQTCKDSNEYIKSLLSSIYLELKEKSRDGKTNLPCLGYTHLQPATVTTMRHRLIHHATRFYDIGANPPYIRMKKYGGGSGTGEALSFLLNGKEYPMKDELPYPIQSTDFLGEIRSSQWLNLIASQVYKFSLDMRILASLGEVNILHPKEYVGSSAMPGKNNPEEFEQLCGLARLQPNYERNLLDCLMNNGLERTLDNSSTIRVTLPEMYNNIAYILEKFLSLIPRISFNFDRMKENLEKNKKRAYVEIKVAEKVKKGFSWTEARKIVEKNNQ